MFCLCHEAIGTQYQKKDPRMTGTRVDHNKQNYLPAKFSFCTLQKSFSYSTTANRYKTCRLAFRRIVERAQNRQAS